MGWIHDHIGLRFVHNFIFKGRHRFLKRIEEFRDASARVLSRFRR